MFRHQGTIPTRWSMADRAFRVGQKGKGALLSKAEAGYRAPDLQRPCVMCCRFDGYRGACSVVAGPVLPDATCDHRRSAGSDNAEQRGFA